jgi:hypothetical protein
MAFGKYSYSPIAIMRFIPGPLTLAISAASAKIQLAPNTFYRFWSSVDCFFDIGPTNSIAATTSSHPLAAKVDYLVFIDSANFWLAAIAASSGTLYISQVDP